jgi:Zn-dependent M28 family amino/carboxypeptidase
MRCFPGSDRLAVALVVVTAATACTSEGPDFAPPDPSAIDAAYVQEVVSTLASDDMRGRRAFTEDAVRAAEYLAGEFEAAGLSPMPGQRDFLQRFNVRSVATDEVSLSIDGTVVPAERVGASLAGASLSWSTGDIAPMIVGPAADARSEIMGAVRGENDALVLVDPAHAEAFAQLSGFLRRPVSSLEGAPARNVVVALVSAGSDASYEVSASATVTDQELINVVGMVPGVRADEYVLFSGHYDHIGIRPAVDGDSIGNGANDDASGTTAVVALADYYADRGTPERSLLFAAFTAEEAGGYGSRYYSQQLDPDAIVAMFNIEMIGKPAVAGPNTAWITGFDRSSFGPLLQEAVQGTEYEFYPDPYPDQNLFYRSDNATLARLGVPAHSISTTPIDVDPDYHQVSDQVETLDLDHMTNTIRAIAMGAETMVTGLATPTRVDPSTVN